MKSNVSNAAGATVLLHDSLQGHDVPGGGSIVFSDVDEIITCRDASEIEQAFSEIEEALDRGCHVAGGFCYELGYYLEPHLLRKRRDLDGPLFQVGVFRDAKRMESADLDTILHQRERCVCADSHLSIIESEAAYGANIAVIKDFIFAGDIYQANYTFPLRFSLQGGIWDFYRQVIPYQNVAFGAVLDLPDIKCASFSPELFFRKTGSRIEARPMKGTTPRGATPDEDARAIDFLRSDEKNRAENLMIVDLIRNDLGRLAEIGSVTVRDAFHVETYETLHQMTSTIEADIRPGISLMDIFRNMFPCGSVTGAPKIRAMEIISDLEAYPRGLYTGAIGYITPTRDMCFSVPIRTVCFDRHNGATIGVGSGVVADSVDADEYDECLLKARFLVKALHADLVYRMPQVGLIETMRAVEGDIPLLDAHMARLINSTKIFGIGTDEAAMRAALCDEVQDTSGEIRLRLQLENDGSFAVTAAPLVPLPDDPVVIPASRRLNSRDPLRSHKSTLRSIYDDERARLKGVVGGYDVLFLNERGDVCEGGITNIFVELDGKMMTPPLSCGVLPGVMRAKLIEEWGCEERILTVDDLKRSSRIILSNAVRGAVEVRLCGFD